jgi:FkbM family methyltransferase
MKKSLRKIYFYYSVLGISGTAAYLLAKMRRKPILFKKSVLGVKHPVFIRVGSTDTAVFRQIFVERHYDLMITEQPNVIVDAGANIGLSAVFFANKYPKALIVAIEPEEANFTLLKKNTSPYPQIKPIRAAVWRESCQINLIDPGSGSHGFQVVETTALDAHQRAVVQAITLDDLYTQMNFSFIDILKIDIEGSEKEVFETSAKWISKVGVIMAELHDQIKEGCSRAFAEATKDLIKHPSKGETVIRLHKIAYSADSLVHINREVAARRAPCD